MTNVAQLQENIAAFEMDIGAEVLAMLDAMRVELGDPAIKAAAKAPARTAQVRSIKARHRNNSDRAGQYPRY